ncbi:response regulator [Undibacterium sp. SXout11W]|uniref:response regulator n=1 Tax=Undibacterium sp. SXout11W TaxID=3413050 RepID=UPI003BF3CECA
MATTIAIIEDNPEFLNRFSQIIQSDPDYLLLGVATNGLDGIALVNNGRADVYLVDLGLPDVDGIEIIKHAVKAHADCDVMVITVFGDDAHIIKSIEAGATGYILKDSSSFDILDCIRTLRDGGSPVNPMIARRILQKFQPEKPNGIESIAITKSLTSAPPALTDRENQMLRALAKGLSFKEIGETHFISAHTVARHVKKIYRTLAVHSRGEAVYEASKMGLLEM